MSGADKKPDPRRNEMPTQQKLVRPRYEYLNRQMDADADLLQYGTEGWELVSAMFVPGDPSAIRCLFRRSC